MKKILVTGADGFIGSHLVERLVNQGYKVRAMVLYNSFNSWGWLDSLNSQIRDSIEIFSGDIRDPFCVNKAVKGCDCVLHLAALIAIPYSYNSPKSYLETNIDGTLNVLQAVKENKCSKMVHISTSEVYGSAQYVPIDENHPKIGQSPYSATKIAADQLAISFNKSFELPVGIIRPFNTFGPRQSNRAVIPTIITQLIDGKNEIKLGNIEATRDFSYVLDTVDGIIAGMNSNENIGKVVNLGAGFEISILKTAKMISGLMGKEIKIITDKQRIRPQESEVNRLFSDNSLAEKIIKWTPKYKGEEGFASGLKKTIDWFSMTKNRKKYKSNIYNQ
jgi:dTDP-glucose 4,6-dehydratase